MHVRHARPSGGHLCALAVTVGCGTCVCRSRCQPSLLVVGETILRTGDHEPSADAWGRDLQCCVESGWAMGGEWRGRRSGQGFFEIERGSRQASVVVPPQVGVRESMVSLAVFISCTILHIISTAERRGFPA